MNEHQQLKPKRQAVLLPVCSVAAVVWMLVSRARIAHDILQYWSMDWFAVLLSPLILLSRTVVALAPPRRLHGCCCWSGLAPTVDFPDRIPSIW